jgi:stalled ribosome rescue protein Dom34
MTSHYHAIVWIDHREAKIFQFDAGDVDATIVHGTHPHEHIHHKANAGDSGHVPVDKAFLAHVAQSLSQAGRILITGPANAKKELAAYLAQAHPDQAAKVAGVEALDHPTDGALVDFARRFFKADDRMQSQLRPGKHP